MSVLFRIALLFVVVVVIFTLVSVYSTFCVSPIHIKKTNQSWGGSSSLLKGACRQSKVKKQSIDFSYPHKSRAHVCLRET